MLSIYSGKGYTYEFATPRVEANFRMRRGFMYELGQKSPWLAGAVGCVAPIGTDLVHAYNGVPTSGRPFVVSCESFLPRIWGSGLPARLKPLFQRILAGDRCRAIVPMSENSASLVRLRNAESPHVARIARKIRVIYPSVATIADGPAAPPIGSGPLTFVFVGRHFGRKGGVACLYLSERLERLGIRHEMHIISINDFGPHIWTDTGEDYYSERLRAAGPSVRFHNRLPAAELTALLARAHFAPLPTLDDTFGVSVLEAMALGSVPIVTGIRALPEMVASPSLLLAVETDQLGRWRRLPASRERRCSAEYRAALDEVQRGMAEQAAAIVQAILDVPARHAELVAAGFDRIRERHHPVTQAERWGSLYQACAG